MGVPNKPDQRKQYTPGFKREAVRLVTDGGLSIAQVARDLGLKDNLVSRWKQEAHVNGAQAFQSCGHQVQPQTGGANHERISFGGA